MSDYTVSDVSIRTRRVGVVATDTNTVRAIADEGRDSVAFLQALETHGVTQEVDSWRWMPLSTGYIIARTMAEENDADEPKLHVIEGVGCSAEEAYAVQVYQAGAGRWWALDCKGLPTVYTWGTMLDAERAVEHASSDPKCGYLHTMVTEPRLIVELSRRYNAATQLPDHLITGFTLA